MTPVAPRIVLDVSYVTLINHEIHFWWHAQYSVMLEGDFVAPRIVLDVSCVTRINHPRHFTWQVQHLVKLEGALCCSAHCTGRFLWEAD